MAVEAVDDRGGVGRQFRLEGVGVGLLRQEVAGRSLDLVLVAVATGDMRDEEFPNAALVTLPHR